MNVHVMKQQIRGKLRTCEVPKIIEENTPDAFKIHQKTLVELYFIFLDASIGTIRIKFVGSH